MPTSPISILKWKFMIIFYTKMDMIHMASCLMLTKNRFRRQANNLSNYKECPYKRPTIKFAWCNQQSSNNYCWGCKLICNRWHYGQDESKRVYKQWIQRQLCQVDLWIQSSEKLHFNFSLYNEIEKHILFLAFVLSTVSW